jgi:hypothetical protein
MSRELTLASARRAHAAASLRRCGPPSGFRSHIESQEPVAAEATPNDDLEAAVAHVSMDIPDNIPRPAHRAAGERLVA